MAKVARLKREVLEAQLALRGFTLPAANCEEIRTDISVSPVRNKERKGCVTRLCAYREGGYATVRLISCVCVGGYATSASTGGSEGETKRTRATNLVESKYPYR